MKAFIVLITAFLSSQSPAQGCFSEHLHEAMRLNRTRLPLYAKATHGRSVPLSLALIASEEAALIQAKFFERRPHRFLCDAFVSMTKTPAFSARVEVSPGPLRNIPVSQWKRDLKNGDVVKVSADAIRYLADVPSYHCMVRHVLESIHHIASLEAKYPAEREEIKKLVAMHIPALSLSQMLDKYAASMQAKGVPILCHDVPRIP